ncbi:MAG: glycosyl hydrolase, partial [Ignavibacteriaceae bacterium]
VYAMSNYNTITSLAESPLMEGLIYAGTDDGLINITEDGGKNWKRIEVGSLPGVPKTAFVDDIKADLFDASTVYVALDNHKYGDFNPYLLKSTDRGKSWISIKSNLPDRTLVWRLVQDYVNPNLLFAATEFGVYFTINGGKKWIKLTGGVPTIAFRDLQIQKRENDLVCGSFGRGIYILDDYSILRNISEKQLNEEATLFQPKKAWWYIQNDLGVVQGSETFTAPNPPFGALFTYYLKDKYKTLKSIRQEKEKKEIEKKEKVSFPGWEELEKERREGEPKIWLTVKDDAGNVIKRVEGKNNKGFNRVAWDLRFPATDAILNESDTKRNYRGAMVAPGEYTVTLSKEIDGITTDLSEPMKFKVERMYKGALIGANPDVTAAFWRETEKLNRSLSAATKILNSTLTKIGLMEKALERTPAAPGNLDKQLYDLKQALYVIDEKMNGNRSKDEVGEKNNPTVLSRLEIATWGSFGSTYGPTRDQKQSLEIAESEFLELKKELDVILNVKLPAFEKALMEAGAPWVAGQPIPELK